MTDVDAEIALLEAGMEGVEIVTCDLCDENGKVGLESAKALCPRCLGKKVTTRRRDDDNPAQEDRANTR